MAKKLSDKQKSEIRELGPWAQSAVSEIAREEKGWDASWHADTLFNEVDTMADLLGDRLIDIVGFARSNGEHEAKWREAVDLLAEMFPHIGEGLRKELMR